jgi:quercetin dioxygenase-like cupin family protein
MVKDDPVVTNPDHYRTLFENEYVRILDYVDEPGDSTTPHDHPNSVLVALTGFRRRLTLGDVEREVELAAGAATWLPAQRHTGTNIGDTPTHTILVELKGDGAGTPGTASLGPDTR